MQLPKIGILRLFSDWQMITHWKTFILICSATSVIFVLLTRATSLSLHLSLHAAMRMCCHFPVMILCKKIFRYTIIHLHLFCVQQCATCLTHLKSILNMDCFSEARWYRYKSKLSFSCTGTGSLYNFLFITIQKSDITIILI